MEQAHLSLFMNLTNTAPEGAGWYLAATMDGRPIMAPISIEPDAALRLSMAFQSAIEGSESEIPTPTPAQLVISGNSLIQAALERQLAYAEAQARQVAHLRRKLSLLVAKQVSDSPVTAKLESLDQHEAALADHPS